jgi:hypothetical protein
MLLDGGRMSEPSLLRDEALISVWATLVSR